MDLSIIMPAYNEQATILDAIKRMLDADLGGISWELIVVDNGSMDDTGELLASIAPDDRVRVLTIDRNRGKGGAIRFGAEQSSGSHVAVLDADLEYDPNDLTRMLPPVLDDGMDAVLSTRHWQAHSAFGFWYVVGNRFINTVANILFNSYISDFASCLKVVRADLFQSLELKENGFGFDAEVVGSLLRRHARIYEVPVQYTARTRAEGKKINARDGVRALWVFIRCRLRPVRA